MAFALLGLFIAGSIGTAVAISISFAANYKSISLAGKI
jgi:hypothetical protein